MSLPHNAADENYVNLTADVSGTINRIRMVKVKGSRPWLSCSIIAKRDGGTTYFDVKVVGEAYDHFKPLIGQTIQARVRVGDLTVIEYPDRKAVDEAGKPVMRQQIKGRLIKVLGDGEECMKKPMVVHGLAYLNRIGEAEGVSRSALSAFHGEVGDFNFVMFDLENIPEVMGNVKLIEPHVPAKRVEGGQYPKINVGFMATDIYPSFFTFKSGTRKGEKRLIIKGKLQYFTHAKVNGEPIELHVSERVASKRK